MKVAIVGSRNLHVDDLEKYLPSDADEIISGGAVGVDSDAKDYALANGKIYTEILPEYEKYGRSAPIKRNVVIIDCADVVYAFWDGKSRGTSFVIDTCKKKNKPIKLFIYRFGDYTEAEI